MAAAPALQSAVNSSTGGLSPVFGEFDADEVTAAVVEAVAFAAAAAVPVFFAADVVFREKELIPLAFVPAISVTAVFSVVVVFVFTFDVVFVVSFEVDVTLFVVKVVVVVTGLVVVVVVVVTTGALFTQTPDEAFTAV